MTVPTCLLCFTAAFLLIHTSIAQGIPGYIPPLYNVPKYVNQGLNAYRQTQQIAKAASGLGLPVPQTQQIVTNVALPLLPPAQKLATNVGLPLLPSAQRLGANVGLPLLPKIFPGGLPVLPQSPPTFAVGTKLRPLSASTLLLNTNPAIPRISPLQIRSTGEETNSEKEQADKAEEPEKEKADTSEKANTEKEQANAALNPINEDSDDEFKEVVGSSGSLYNETTTDKVHQTKTRSPDNKGDELDYLSKAANPIDDIGSLIKKVGHGLKHTMEKVDTTLWPSHAKPEMKDLEQFTMSFEEWSKLPENMHLPHEEKLEKWKKRLYASRHPEFRIPIQIAVDMGTHNAKPEMKEAGQFTMSFAEWSKLPENAHMTMPEKIIKWTELVNASRDPEFRIPIQIAVDMAKPNAKPQMKEAGQFIMSFAEWSKLPENAHMTMPEKIIKWTELVNASRDPEFRIPIQIAVDMAKPNAKPQMKEAGLFTMSFAEWSKLPENEHMTMTEKFIKWTELVNASRDPEFRIPIQLPVDMGNPNAKPQMKEAGQFTMSFEEWSKLPENAHMTMPEKIIKWTELVNANRDPEFRIPIQIAVDMAKPNAKPQMKEAGQFTMSFTEWSKLPENAHMTMPEKIIKWTELVNASRDPEFRIPIQIAVDMAKPNAKPQMKESGQFTMSFAEWSKLPENAHMTTKEKFIKWTELVNASRDPEFRIPIQLPVDMGTRNAKPEINPMNKLFESAAKLADSFIEAMSRSGTNRKEPSELGQTNNPMNIYWKEASDSAGRMINSKYPGALPSPQSNNKDWQMVLDLAQRLKDSSKDKDKEFIAGTAAMTDKGAQFGTHPNGYFNGNQQMLYPYSPAFGSTYNQWNQPGYGSPIFDPAANFAHSTSGFNSAGGYYKSNNPSEILSNPMAQYTAMYPVLSRTYRQMPPPPLPAYGRPNPIGELAHAAVDTVRSVLGGRKNLPPPPPPPPFGGPPSTPFGIPPPPPPHAGPTRIDGPGSFGSRHIPPHGGPPSPPFGIPPTPHVGPAMIDGPGSFGGRHIPPHGGPLIKRSGSSGNVWDSATGLADSITNTATNPGKINADQILGSTGTIFNAAKDLAGNIGKVATNPSSITNNTPMDIKEINSDKLLGSSKVGDSLINQAVGMAGKIVNTALNPGLNGNGQLLQSLGPTYAGGFFPRSNPSGSIVNSATQLASQILNSAATNSGNIGKIPLLKATPAIGNYAGALPLGSILNSATKLAGDITNVATVPGKLLV